MAKAFYLKLAWSNILRNRRTFFPYILTTAIISGVYLLIGGLMFSKGLANLPTGKTASMLFAFGLIVFSIFSFFFMVYINNFIVGRRKREFGLYGILGLEKRHVARVLLLENLLTLGAGLLCGVAIALVFGRLLFLILLRMIHAAAGSGSVFSIAPQAYLITAGLFLGVYVVTSVLNLWKVRLASPIELMSSEKRGEKDSKLMIPLTILGAAFLVFSYYSAWTIRDTAIALSTFFLLAVLVILATNILFHSGSIATLRALRANKRFYYRSGNFIAIGGMFQRMRQNAKSLATICILSTMLIVTVSGTLSLYLGQEKMLDGMYPYDVSVEFDQGTPDQQIADFDRAVVRLAEQTGVTVTAPRSKLVSTRPGESMNIRNNYVPKDAVWVNTPNLICYNLEMRFDVEGPQDKCLTFIDGLRQLHKDAFPQGKHHFVSNVFEAKEEGYGMYGGLLFLGVFFGVLFLAVMVLIIYFKQISEGYEDKAQFAILQKVGMDDGQVKSSINRQVLLVFFIPLGMTILHMVFASRIMARMLQAFMLYDWMLVLLCIGGVCVFFTVLYLIVYRLTARVYYRIVKW